MTDFADPLAIFRAAVDALNAEDWRGAAALCDPVSLRAFHRGLVEQFTAMEPPVGMTPEEYMRFEPDMPREVAEHHVAQQRKHSDPAWRLARELPGVASAAALRDLSPEAAYAFWLDGKSVRRQVERLVADGRVSPAVAAHRGELRAHEYQYVALGVVPDGDRVCHVLYRPAMDDQIPWTGDAAKWLERMPPDEQLLTRETMGRSHPSVATCRRQPDGTWRLIADHDFLRVGSMHIADIREGDAGEHSETWIVEEHEDFEA